REKANEFKERVIGLVKKGNVTHIRIRKGDKVVNIPMTAGIVGVFIGVAAAPLVMIIGAIVMIGLDCKVEIVKGDGEVTVIEDGDEDSIPGEAFEDDEAELVGELEEILDEEAAPIDAQ
ncbi:MAG: DUF4342 domain-containing protein, partial [Lachnospiraceae bacterium]|nr:DUF4342 domain-containing protein [Lachnospiraceae bacterium]